MSKPFKTTISEGIAELVFDHPPVNAFDSKGWAAIAEEIEALGQNDAVNVIVIAAEGRGFCAGVDIKELAADRNLIVKVNKGNYDTFRAVHRNPKPVIVAVHGFVLGGGIGISGAADIVVAAVCARFGLPEVDRGAMGGGAQAQREIGAHRVAPLRAVHRDGQQAVFKAGENGVGHGFLRLIVGRNNGAAARGRKQEIGGAWPCGPFA